ncbi:hypothetical protein D043_4458A, partial [Vibrio parahaemolyticus EKP-021]
MLDVGRRS